MRDTLTEETQLDRETSVLSSKFFRLSLGGSARNSDEFWKNCAYQQRDADLRRDEKSKITPEALPFPSTRRRDNAPPLRFVDGWATDAARRKIERNKKNARRGDGRERFGWKSEKSLDSRGGSINFIFIIGDCVSFSLFFSSFSLSLSLFPPSPPLRDLLSGVVDATDYYCSPSMHARMIRQTELDCFSVPLHPFRTPFVRSLFVHHVKQVFRINVRILKRNAYLRHIK